MKRTVLTIVAFAAVPVIAGAQQTGSEGSMRRTAYSTRELQTALSQAGYYTGPRNGRMTSATQAAVRRAGQEMGVPTPTGREVLAALNGEGAVVSAGPSSMRTQDAAGREGQATTGTEAAGSSSAMPQAAPSTTPTPEATSPSAPADSSAMTQDSTMQSSDSASTAPSMTPSTSPNPSATPDSTTATMPDSSVTTTPSTTDSTSPSPTTTPTTTDSTTSTPPTLPRDSTTTTPPRPQP